MGRFGKAFLLAIAVSAAVAFSAPAAQGSITLYDPIALVHLQPGSQIEATSANTQVTIGGGNSLQCAHLALFGQLTGPEETTVEGFAGTGNAEECTVNGVVPATITAIEAVAKFEPSGAGTVAFAFLYDVPLIGFNECVEEAGGVPVNWTEGTDVIHLAGGPLLGTGAGCPAGAEEIHGTFTVTHNGSSVIRT